MNSLIYSVYIFRMFALLKVCLSVFFNSTSLRIQDAFKVKLIVIQFILYEYLCVITYLGQVDGIQSYCLLHSRPAAVKHLKIESKCLTLIFLLLR